MTHSLLRLAIAGFMLVAGALAADPVEARVTPRKCKATAPETLAEDVALVDHRALKALDVHENMVTAIEMPGKITQMLIPQPMLNHFWIQQTGKDHEVFEFKPTSAPAESMTGITLKSGHDTVHLLVHVAKDAKDTGCLLYRVGLRSPLEVWKERLKSWVQEQIDEQRARDAQKYAAERKKELAGIEAERKQEREGFERQLTDQETAAAFAQRAAVARFVLQRRINTRTVPVGLKVPAGRLPVNIKVYEPAWNGGEFLIPFEVESPEHSAPAVLVGIEAAPEFGGQMDSELLVMQSMRETTQGIATISKEYPARGVLSLPAASEQSIGATRLVFMLQGGTPVVASVPKWYPLDVARYDRERRAKQVSVSVRLLGGAFWTDPDGADDMVTSPTGISGTSMTGIAVRYQKGYMNGFALELEGAGARTGQARFRDVEWNGMQGEVARSASLFRFMAGGAARLGDKYVTTVRLGVGVQATSYNSSFTTAGTTMDGPGASFEIDGVWSFGASFDARLGKSWVLGLGATMVAGVKSDALGLNAGIQLGYRWNP